MINELIILLSDKQQQELIKRANQASYEDDLAYLQEHISEWLKNDDEIAKALAARLIHTEK